MFQRTKPAPTPTPARLPALTEHQIKVLSRDHAAKSATVTTRGAFKVTCACGHVLSDSKPTPAAAAHIAHLTAVFTAAQQRLAAFDATRR